MSAAFNQRLVEADNFDEMAANSRKIAFVRSCLSDEAGAAYWRGRARGLELAAFNLRLPALPPTDALDQPERSAGPGPNR